MPLWCGLGVSLLILWLVDFDRLSVAFDFEAWTVAFLGIIFRAKTRENPPEKYKKRFITAWSAHTKWKAINFDRKTSVICIIIIEQVNTRLVCVHNQKIFHSLSSHSIAKLWGKLLCHKAFLEFWNVDSCGASRSCWAIGASWRKAEDLSYLVYEDSEFFIVSFFKRNRGGSLRDHGEIWLKDDSFLN